MRIISLIGCPVIIENPSPYYPIPDFLNVNLLGFFAKDSEIRGFKLTKNHYFNDRSELFEQYQTFENENGIGVVGKSKAVVKTYPDPYNVYCVSGAPFYVGDVVAKNEYVKCAISDFNIANYKWEIRFETMSSIPDPATVDFENQYNTKISDAFASIQTALDELKDAFTTTSVGVPAMGWGTPPNSIGWNQSIEKAKQDIQQAIDDLGEVVT